MKHSITVLAAAALFGATCAAKADNIKPNPHPNPPPAGPSTSGSGQQTKEPGITDKGYDLDSDKKSGARTSDDVIREILKDRHSK
jgi:hypothetical protein